MVFSKKCIDRWLDPKILSGELCLNYHELTKYDIGFNIRKKSLKLNVDKYWVISLLTEAAYIIL